MKILVVEDEKKIAGLIKRGLEEDDYSVTVAMMVMRVLSMPWEATIN